MIHESDNKQAIRSKESIANALFRLMGTERYQDVTVLQICQLAQVARQTFYRNFDRKRDVLDYYIARRFRDFIRGHPDSNDGAENLRVLFSCFPLPRESLLLLKRHGLFHVLEEDMRGFISGPSRRLFDFSALDGGPEYRQYYDGYVAAALGSVLSTWVDRGFRETPQELASICSKLLARFPQ